MSVSPYASYSLATQAQSWRTLYQAGSICQTTSPDVGKWHEEPADEASLRIPTRLSKEFNALRDRRFCVRGDLGWTLNYATAFLYRFLNCNRFGVIAAINDARRAPLTPQTPYIIFETLNKALFASKLTGAVLLLWKAFGSDHLGTTSSPGVVAPRICIQLNSSPFALQIASMSTLLEMLIHQMVHAYFLICCGSQKMGDKQDGRLHDGLHFGVISGTLNDITQPCTGGCLNMAFHASDRSSSAPSRQSGGRFLSLDARGISLPLPLCDGRSHCMHDNRDITRAQLLHWQVQEYARAIGDNGDSRDQHVFFCIRTECHRLDRTHGPPSQQYSEIIWDNKRYAVPRERASKFAALTALGNENKFGDMKLPDCSIDIFNCIWRYVTFGEYDPASSRDGDSQTASGPPVLLSPHSRRGESIRIHVQVCKFAEALRFSELHDHAISRLYSVAATGDDPIALLRDIYDSAKPLSVALHSWARKFLARNDGRSGLSNYEKISKWHQARFAQVFGQFSMLREDCLLVIATLRCGIDPSDVGPPPIAEPASKVRVLPLFDTLDGLQYGFEMPERMTQGRL